MSERLTQAQVTMSLLKTSSAPAQLSPQQMELAASLQSRHGTLKVANENHGLHFYIACPNCLSVDGGSELYKMHLAINVTKYTQGMNFAAHCMKCSTNYMIDTLTMWKRLEDRGYDRGPAKIITTNLMTEETHEQDGNGQWAIKAPGLTVPLSFLPEDHPARVYLKERQFDIEGLSRQFNCDYCLLENDTFKYKKFAGGFSATPQGRIIFYIIQNGLRVGWQGRLIEKVSEHEHLIWHPYEEQWVAVEHRESRQHEWVDCPGYGGFRIPKYLGARGMARNSCLMGFDSLVAFSKDQKHPWVIICEGPLDAARLGLGAVAVCGKFASAAQVELMLSVASTIIVIPDADLAGSRLFSYIGQWVAGRCRVEEMKLPPGIKDAGELSPEAVVVFREDCLRKLGLWENL